jgi:hypothetical protein
MFYPFVGEKEPKYLNQPSNHSYQSHHQFQLYIPISSIPSSNQQFHSTQFDLLCSFLDLSRSNLFAFHPFEIQINP